MKIGNWEIGIGTMWNGIDNPKRDWKTLEFDMVYCECPQFEHPEMKCTCGDEVVIMYFFYWPRLKLSRIVFPMRAVLEQDP